MNYKTQLFKPIDLQGNNNAQRTKDGNETYREVTQVQDPDNKKYRAVYTT